ncbi:NUDIX hydrolase [Sphaerochaeta halotolerans]|uniref:NUDIX hydrolase n=1 Tax=Sphaerochaeta halotolerans TaxID=2293840 RepID=UPI00136F5755|nr:NUDIX hydrolase [Sphaerochaeta halotolerans]MBG0766783.1 NUDIX hydrolase [Spirochaetaceae bacterium]MDK2859730.1 8-oxo-dGTP diphosphatase [Sphaerochaeta sp.]MXI85876.1 NUDIX domain-containing protein [Sphaerochaeta halotolerans]
MHLPYHGAGIIFWTITEKGELSFLMGNRSMSPQNHHWSFPGGTWERARDGYDTKGKISYRETAKRECLEEVGLDVPSPEHMLLIWSLDVPGFHYKVFAYHLDEQVKPPYIDEFSEVGWFTFSTVPSPTVTFVRTQIRKLKHYVEKLGC